MLKTKYKTNNSVKYLVFDQMQTKCLSQKPTLCSALLKEEKVHTKTWRENLIYLTSNLETVPK